MYILRKEYFSRYGRAQEAFRTRAKPRGRPATSDRPPPRRCGQAVWAAAGRPYFATTIINSNETEASASGRRVRACVARESKREES
jgi:hypothetical protein